MLKAIIAFFKMLNPFYTVKKEAVDVILISNTVYAKLANEGIQQQLFEAVSDITFDAVLYEVQKLDLSNEDEMEVIDLVQEHIVAKLKLQLN